MANNDKAKLEDTGERMIPEFHKGRNMYGAHIGRYQAGLEILEGKVVLDIACGSGYGSQIISKHAKKVIAVDIDKDTIEYAKENYQEPNIEYLVGDGVSIPVGDDSVDMVVSYETIEHIEDYDSFMKEVKRVLKPGGLLLLSTPNDAQYHKGNHFHYFEFSYEQLVGVVEKYFKHHKDYFQTLWYSSTIVSKKQLENEWEQEVKTINTIKLAPEDCIYFFIVCSDAEIEDEVEPVAVIGEHYIQNKVFAAAENYRKTKNRLNEALQLSQKRKEKIQSLEEQLIDARKQIDDN